MTSYRQMRRQARHVRRVGLQPIMIISNDGQFPAPAGVILARYAWRYRSELAPVFAACTVLCAGWWLHVAHPRWWPSLVRSYGCLRCRDRCWPALSCRVWRRFLATSAG
jgi:hypothetical protein